MDTENNTPAPVVDTNNDGHDDRNGQFVEGNQEALSGLTTEEEQISLAELELIASAEKFLAAAAAFASLPATPSFYVGEGYRLQFGGPQLYSLVTA